MATQVASYPNSGDLKSAKLAPLALERIDASRLKPGLARTLRYLVIRSQYGPDLWAPTFKVSVDAGFHYRTVQRHIDKLERLKVLKLKHSANTHVNGKIRRSATYVLHEESEKVLAPRQNYEEWKKCNGREAPARFRSSAPSSPVPIRSEVKPAAPRAEHRSNGREPNRRERQEMAAKVALVRQLKEGCKSYYSKPDGMMIRLSSDDPRYREPMSLEAAIAEACMTDPVVPEKKVREWLKLLPKSLEETT